MVLYYMYFQCKAFHYTAIVYAPHKMIYICVHLYTHSPLPGTRCWTSFSAMLVSTRTLAIVRACMSYWPPSSLSSMLRWETLMTTPWRKSTNNIHFFIVSAKRRMGKGEGREEKGKSLGHAWATGPYPLCPPCWNERSRLQLHGMSQQ